MTVATSLSYDIRLVSEAAPADGGLRILFRDGGSAILDATHPHYAVCRINAESRKGALCQSVWFWTRRVESWT